MQFSLHLRGYILLLTDSLYFATYLNSVKIAAITTLCCVLIGYPIAYYIARSSPSVRNLLLLGVILPFWTSLLLRVYAWVGILRNDGLLNNLLQALASSPARWKSIAPTWRSISAWSMPICRSSSCRCTPRW